MPFCLLVLAVACILPFYFLDNNVFLVILPLKKLYMIFTWDNPYMWICDACFVRHVSCLLVRKNHPNKLTNKAKTKNKSENEKWVKAWKQKFCTWTNLTRGEPIYNLISITNFRHSLSQLFSTWIEKVGCKYFSFSLFCFYFSPFNIGCPILFLFQSHVGDYVDLCTILPRV